MSLTVAQKNAVEARGNVLVAAGAGAGKTSTLVARCLHCLIEERPPVSLEELLLVTFTEAAATDMRKKIREALENKVTELRQSAAAGAREDAVLAGRLAEQLALFETARIGTLHGFCLRLVRQHFHVLELDPQVVVLAEEDAWLLAEETLQKIFEGHYSTEAGQPSSVQELVQVQGNGWDKPIRALVRKLHNYTQTLRDAEGWLDDQLAMFESPEPTRWRLWLADGLEEWRRRWSPTLHAQAAQNAKAAECAELLAALPAAPSFGDFAAVLRQVKLADQTWPPRKKTAWRKPLEGFFEGAAFLGSLTGGTAGIDPLAEDWNWTRFQMATLLRLTREFTKDFSRAKREQGVVDFHDLEQHALRLLRNPKTGEPTEVARHWRETLRFIFVDEYQDINEAQDAILTALSRDGARANRFLVGDVKQSIYRFRLANPHIFQGYDDLWRTGDGRVISLADNFRSREAILNFVNSLFASLLRREIGGVPYDESARLRFGDAENRAHLGAVEGAPPRVELRLRLTGTADAQADDDSAAMSEMMNLEEAGKEARLTALRLRELKDTGHLIWDDGPKTMRPVEWRDMAILLRSPSGKAESYAREFARLGVPVTVSRGGFYKSLEISDLLSLLQILDNPLQDLPVLAVLHSPLVGLSVDELATIRLAVPKGYFWAALRRYHETDREHSGWAKVARFLRQFAAWRRLARQVSLSRCLEEVLEQTHYASWLLTQPHGDQRHANVRRFVALAQQFDQFKRQGLFRFLKHIEAQRDAETEPEKPAAGGGNAVSVMSIHQSKGLEFPVVVVADLGKAFNLMDLNAEIILDEKYGLCPRIKPPHSGQRYPSLPYWLARQRQKRESLGEEMRLLYVATTRARDTLILTGNLPEKRFHAIWGENSPADSRIESPNQREHRQGASGYGVPPSGGPARANTGDLRIPDPLDNANAPPAKAGTPNPDAQIFASLKDQPSFNHDVHGAATETTTDSQLGARTYLDWLGAWAAGNSGAVVSSAEGQNNWWSWKIFTALDDRLLEAPPVAAEIDPDAPAQLDAMDWRGIRERLAWQYPHLAATKEPAKTSVSILRRRLAEEFEVTPRFKFQARKISAPSADQLSAAEIGTAHHVFMQLVALECPGTEADLRMEAARMTREGALTAAEVAHLDFDALASFWRSDLGAHIRRMANYVRRELPFTARFAPEELDHPELFAASQPGEEFVIVQGLADLAVILPEEIWLVDFKTDHFPATELVGKTALYELQLRLYARALERIYRRPVTRAYLHFFAVHQSILLTV